MVVCMVGIVVVMVVVRVQSGSIGRRDRKIFLGTHDGLAVIPVFMPVGFSLLVIVSFTGSVGMGATP